MNHTELIYRLMGILESLTPGGSEFENNPEACARFVRSRMSSVGKIASERNRLRDENARLSSALREIYDCGSIRKAEQIAYLHIQMDE